MIWSLSIKTGEIRAATYAQISARQCAGAQIGPHSNPSLHLPWDCTFDDLELVHKSLITLEPLHTHKFPPVNAQDSKLGPIQPWDVKDFLTLTVSDSRPASTRVRSNTLMPLSGPVGSVIASSP